MQIAQFGFLSRFHLIWKRVADIAQTPWTNTFQYLFLFFADNFRVHQTQDGKSFSFRGNFLNGRAE